MADEIEIAVPALVDEVAALFARHGLGSAAAREVAEALVEAERQGLRSHGLTHVPLYLARLRGGTLSTAEAAESITDRGAIAVLDAHHMLGHLSGRQAMMMAVEKADTHGIGIVAVRHGAHFGAAGRYAEMAAKRGCIGLALSNTRPMMPTPGGAEPVVGNNPIAIAIPTAQEPAIIVDMATSEGALGRIRVAQQAGASIPATWAVSREGLPTTDPAEALKGMLLPSGGAKGFALSLAIDLMCGLLSGGAVGGEVNPLYGDVGKPNDCSCLFIAINGAFFGERPAMLDRADRARQRIEASRTVAGIDRVVAPGRRKWEKAQAQQATVRIDAQTLQALRAC